MIKQDDDALILVQVSDKPTGPSVTLVPKHSDSRKMLGAEFTGKKSITVNERSVPMLTDAVICHQLHLHLLLMPCGAAV